MILLLAVGPQWVDAKFIPSGALQHSMHLLKLLKCLTVAILFPED
jgi:hypothetical protein